MQSLRLLKGLLLFISCLRLNPHERKNNGILELAKTLEILTQTGLSDLLTVTQEGSDEDSSLLMVVQLNSLKSLYARETGNTSIKEGCRLCQMFYPAAIFLV